MPLSLIYHAGISVEAPIGVGVAPSPRIISSPTVEDVGIGELVYDPVGMKLVLRLGDYLFSFPQSQLVTSFPGVLDFSVAQNSHWIGIMV